MDLDMRRQAYEDFYMRHYYESRIRAILDRIYPLDTDANPDPVEMLDDIEQFVIVGFDDEADPEEDEE